MSTKVLEKDKVTKSKANYTPLMNKKVQIALIEQSTTALYKDKDQATLLIGASKDFACPIDKYGNLIDPLTDQERTWLENKLKIDLNVHTRNTPDNPKANFWTTKKSKVVLRKTSKKIDSATITLDLSEPFQFIMYKIALINPRVAKTWDTRYSEGKGKEFVIKDGSVELEEELTYLAIEDKVLEYLLSIKKSKKKLFDLIRLYGSDKNSGLIKYDTSIDSLYNDIRKYTRIKSEVKKLYKIITLGEKDIFSRVFLADAVSVGLVEKRGWEYRLMGGDKIGGNDIEAMGYLDDPVNQSVKLKIQQAIETFYKKK